MGIRSRAMYFIEGAAARLSVADGKVEEVVRGSGRRGWQGINTLSNLSDRIGFTLLSPLIDFQYSGRSAANIEGRNAEVLARPVGQSRCELRDVPVAGRKGKCYR